MIFNCIQMCINAAQRAKELEKIESEIHTRTVTNNIQKHKIQNILEFIDNEQVNLFSPDAVRTLLECIKVINKHQVEFQLKCDMCIVKEL